MSKNSCPDNGTCTFDVIKNRQIKLSTDKFGNTYELISEGKSILLKFEYQKNTIPNVADGDYRELIYIQIDPDQKHLELIDEDLEKVNLSFGRFCFCKGQTGYYKIRKGTLVLTKITQDTYNVKLKFTITEVPQIITEINEDFTIKP